MTDIITGSTQLVATKMDIIAAITQKELAFQAKLMGAGVDYSAFAIKGAKQVEIPKAGSFTVENRASGVAGTIAALTFATDAIPMDQRAFISWLIDQNDAQMSTVEVQSVYAQRAATAHARAWDNRFNAVALAAAVPVSGVTGDITLGKFLNLRSDLVSRDADQRQMNFICAPDQYAKLLGDADVSRFINYGSGNALPSGVVPTLYGVNVIEHNGLSAGDYYMMDRDAIGYATSLDPNIDSEKAVGLGTRSELVAMDWLYGHTALFKGQRGVQATESALIVTKDETPAPPGPG